MNVLNDFPTIPSDFLDPIRAADPRFPDSILEAIDSKNDDEIKDACTNIIRIQEEYGEFDFQSIEKWFEKPHFIVLELLELLRICGLERFTAIKDDIDKLFTFSEDKLSLRDLYSEDYSPEDIIAGMLGSLSHGRKTYPEAYKDVVADIVKKTRTITL